MDDVGPAGCPERREQAGALPDLDACFGKTLRERAVRTGDQYLLLTQLTERADKQFSLAFPATVAFCQVDVGNSHDHRSPRVWNGR